MLRLLRRLWPGRAREPKTERSNPGAPPSMRHDQEEIAAARIEAARQRLKQTIPPPQDDETGGAG